MSNSDSTKNWEHEPRYRQNKRLPVEFLIKSQVWVDEIGKENYDTQTRFTKVLFPTYVIDGKFRVKKTIHILMSPFGWKISILKIQHSTLTFITIYNTSKLNNRCRHWYTIVHKKILIYTVKLHFGYMRLQFGSCIEQKLSANSCHKKICPERIPKPPKMTYLFQN